MHFAASSTAEVVHMYAEPLLRHGSKPSTMPSTQAPPTQAATDSVAAQPRMELVVDEAPTCDEPRDAGEAEKRRRLGAEVEAAQGASSESERARVIQKIWDDVRAENKRKGIDGEAVFQDPPFLCPRPPLPQKGDNRFHHK